GRGGEQPFPALVDHPARGRLEPARDDLHQRRLAGAVVAEQRHHLAAADVERDAAQRLDGAELAGDLLQPEQRPGHVAYSPLRGTTGSGSPWSSSRNSVPSRGDSSPETASAAAPRRTA